MRLVPAALAVLALLSADIVSADVLPADHEVSSRYVVLGYVRDARGTPRTRELVELIRDKTGYAYGAETDDTGFFVIVAHLGDESAGETLTVQVAEASTTVTVRFDPTNHTDERGTRIDVEGARFAERPAWFRPTLHLFLGSPAR